MGEYAICLDVSGLAYLWNRSFCRPPVSDVIPPSLFALAMFCSRDIMSQAPIY